MADPRELEIRPDAAPAQRRAIEAAVAARAEEEAAPVRSAWWRAGVDENAADPQLGPPA